LREAYYGTTRFDDFAQRVGITKAAASARLSELVDLGLLTRQPYREPGQRTRDDYVLTEAGIDFMPVVGRVRMGSASPPWPQPTAAHPSRCGADAWSKSVAPKAIRCHSTNSAWELTGGAGAQRLSPRLSILFRRLNSRPDSYGRGRR